MEQVAAMSILSTVSVDDIRQRGTIRDSDVLAMRRAYYEDGVIASSEAERLIELNDACRITDPTWAPFFIEALTDYIVNQAEPEGYIIAENAQWLVARISRDGRVETTTELELLISVIDKARWAPPSLSAFALEQVRQAVISGEGVTRVGLALEPGVIGRAEIDLLRRILYGFAGDGGIAVTRAEAEVLIALNKELSSAKCGPEWTDLFVKAVGSSVLATLGHHMPPREEALRVEVWARDADARGAVSLLGDALGAGDAGGDARSRIGRFLGRMVEDGVTGVWGTYRMQSAEERALARLERQRLEIVTQEEITGAEADWLASQLGKDGRLDANEVELLAFLQRESPAPHPGIKALAMRHGIAA